MQKTDSQRKECKRSRRIRSMAFLSRTGRTVVPITFTVTRGTARIGRKRRTQRRRDPRICTRDSVRSNRGSIDILGRVGVAMSMSMRRSMRMGWMASLLILVVGVSVELPMAMCICRRASRPGRRCRSRPRTTGRPRRGLHGSIADFHAFIRLLASTVVINVHWVLCVFVRVVVVGALTRARVGGGWGHEVVLEPVETGVVDATACHVRIWETNRRTSRMIPPMAAHIGVDVELAPTSRKWTAICYRQRYQHKRR